MADAAAIDVTKLKVVDLRKELKSRGLSHTGDKAELMSRLHAALSQETHDDSADINLDSDEIDSDAVLDEEDTLNGTVDEELALAENPPPVVKPQSPPKAGTKVTKLLKRKSTTSESDSAKSAESKEAGGKKIVLNRVPILAPAAVENTLSENTESDTLKDNITEKQDAEHGKVKISTNLDKQSRLELRAKRFGLPVTVMMSDEERKAARMQRFGHNTSAASITSDNTASLGDNLEKLKKRAERFGQNVSKVMSDIEMKERLEKRKAKFGITK